MFLLHLYFIWAVMGMLAIALGFLYDFLFDREYLLRRTRADGARYAALGLTLGGILLVLILFLWGWEWITRIGVFKGWQEFWARPLFGKWGSRAP